MSDAPAVPVQPAGKQSVADRIRRIGDAARRGFDHIFGKHEEKEAHIDDVLGAELGVIGARRRALGLDFPTAATAKYDDQTAWDANLLGLCFSGGGIRSATFNLGVLQALARHGLLRRVDYLSTVSGGGYIGAWLTALLHRTFADRRETLDAATFRKLERELSWAAGEGDSTAEGEPPEHRAIKFLREYSNYLTPTLGVFSGDTWALLATYVRNAVLNQLVLAFALVCGLLVPRFLSSAVRELAGRAGAEALPAYALVGVGIAVLAAYPAWRLGWNVAGILDEDHAKPNPHGTLGVALNVVAPMLAGGVLCGVLILAPAPWLGPLLQGDSGWLVAAAAGAVGHMALWLVVCLGACLSPWSQPDGRRLWTAVIVASVPAGAVLGLLLFLAGSWLPGIAYAGYLLLWTPTAVVASLLATSILHIGLVGACLDAHQREWFSRLGGLMAILTFAWLAVCGLVVVAPLLVHALGVLNVPLVLGWLATTLGGVYFGRSGGGTPPLLKRAVMILAPWVFIAGLLVFLSAGLQQVLHAATNAFGGPAANVTVSYEAYRPALDAYVEQHLPRDEEGEVEAEAPLDVPWAAYGAWLQSTERPRILGGVLVAAFLLMYVLSSRVDINGFSLHNMYANRLVRCFLGATTPRSRRRNPFSGFSSQDDLRLVATRTAGKCLLRPVGESGRDEYEPGAAVAAPFPGPYHVVNTAINLSSSGHTGWQERKAASFVLSPLYCGFSVPGTKTEEGGLSERHAYRETRDYGFDPKPLTLGEAIATSGAAASPTMGYHTTAPLAFLMGVFNIRLGRWAANPRQLEGLAPGHWHESGPSFALLSLLREVLGRTDDENRFVYLSDGGHFENLALYEMVRRRCRYVIACDCGADPEYAFEDLGNAIRKCRIDLGVEIEIDVAEIARIDADRHNGAPCAVGKIRYSPDRVGTLLYVKSSRRRGWPTDVVQYARHNATFPHESTADQFFSESQFESYRRLGHFLATTILDPAVEETLTDTGGTPAGGVGDCDLESFFRKLQQRWYPSSPATPAHFSALTAQIDTLFERLRGSKELEFLTEQFYPEWRTLMDPRSDMPAEHRAEMWDLPDDEEKLKHGFYFCNSAIQLMESVYLDLDLEAAWAHPDNSGWISVFRHWTWSSMFRVTWAISAATYGRRFRDFCRLRLDLDAGVVGLTRVFRGRAQTVDGLALDDSRLNLVERTQIATLFQTAGLAGRDVTVVRLDMRVTRPLVETPGSPDDLLRSFAFGYALVADDELVMYRVQDHLRDMGLGRSGLEALLAEYDGGGPLKVRGNAERLLRAVNEPVDPKHLSDFRAMFQSRAKRATGRQGA